VIDGVQNKPLVLVAGAQIGLVEKRVANRQAGLPVAVIAESVA